MRRSTWSWGQRWSHRWESAGTCSVRPQEMDEQNVGFIWCYSLNLSWWTFYFLLMILLVWSRELITFMNDSAWSCDHMGFCSHCWGSRPIIFSEVRKAAFKDSVQSNSKAANSIPSSQALKIFKQKQFSRRSYKYQGEECRHKTLQKWLKTSSKGLMVLTQIFPTSKVGVKLLSAGTNWFPVTIIQHLLGCFNMKMVVSLRSSLPWFLRADFRFSLFSYIANKKEHVYLCVHIPFNKWSNKSFYCHRPGLLMNKPSANSSILNIQKKKTLLCPRLICVSVNGKQDTLLDIWSETLFV